MAAWIRADLHQELTIRQYTGQAFVTGELFQLPAGPVGAAFGVDYRKDSQELTGDILSQTGGTTGNAVPNFGGSIRALEGYGEVSVQIGRASGRERVGQYVEISVVAVESINKNRYQYYRKIGHT